LINPAFPRRLAFINPQKEKTMKTDQILIQELRQKLAARTITVKEMEHKCKALERKLERVLGPVQYGNGVESANVTKHFNQKAQ
tara:strand:- start:1139 stop:1390 length:252 start_codon:yes stop_codon:yes gene_type:complete